MTTYTDKTGDSASFTDKAAIGALGPVKWGKAHVKWKDAHWKWGDPSPVGETLFPGEVTGDTPTYTDKGA